jgi:hypothetical protein
MFHVEAKPRSATERRRRRRPTLIGEEKTTSFNQKMPYFLRTLKTGRVDFSAIAILHPPLILSAVRRKSPSPADSSFLFSRTEATVPEFYHFPRNRFTVTGHKPNQVLFSSSPCTNFLRVCFVCIEIVYSG